jgi:hypothetical protein
MKKLYIKFSVFFFALLVSTLNYGQVGIQTTSPKGVLDIEATNRGLIYPVVALANINTQTITNPNGGNIVAGTTVYNTATTAIGVNSVYPGIYIWDGAKWVPQFEKRDRRIYFQNSDLRTGSNDLTNPVSGNQAVSFNTASNYPFVPKYTGKYKVELIVNYGGGKLRNPTAPANQKVNIAAEEGVFNFTFNGTPYSFSLRSYSGLNDDKLFKGGAASAQRVYTNSYQQTSYIIENTLTAGSSYTFGLTFNQINAPDFEGNGDISIIPAGDGRGYIATNGQTKCSVEITYIGE